MKKMSATTTLALLLVLILGSTVAYAAFNWCPDDPILDIGGTTVNVIVEIPEGTLRLVNGPVHVKVHVPEGVETGYTIPEDSSFTTYGYIVEFFEDGRPGKVKVEVLVPATEKFPVRVTIEAPDDSETKVGRSNKWVKCKVELEVEVDGDDDDDDDDD